MPTRSLTLLVLLTAAVFGPAAVASAAESLDAAALRQALDDALDSHPVARRTTVALKVLDLPTGAVLYDRGGDRLLTPASNLKIYTAAAALAAFGPEHRFTTIARAAGPVDAGALHGDLVLIGGGDAMLTHDDLARLADRVVSDWQLKKIAGRVVVDNSRYGSPLKGPGWMWDDEPEYYNMSVTPLMVDFNVLTVRLSHGPGGATAALVPPADHPRIVRLPGPGGDAPARVTRQPFTDELTLIDGAVPKDATARLSMHDPASWIAAMMTRMLADRGVAFVESPPSPAVRATSPTEAQAAEIAAPGKTLAETLRHLHAESENAVGEVLLHEIAIQHGVARPDWPAAAKVVADWLVEEAGLERDSFRLIDGSGLSRYNLITADSSVRLLTYLHGSEHFETFYDSLPTEKVDGAPVLRAKGGSMSGVSTISGYITTQRGRRLAFSLLANGFLGDNRPVFDLRQKVWRELMRYEP